jgi:hypothetical protein
LGDFCCLGLGEGNFLEGLGLLGQFFLQLELGYGGFLGGFCGGLQGFLD